MRSSRHLHSHLNEPKQFVDHHLMGRLTERERRDIRIAQQGALQQVLQQAMMDAKLDGQPPVDLAERFVAQLKVA